MNGLNTPVEELEKSEKSLKLMSAKERDLIIKKDHPELLPLLKEMKEKSEEITTRVLPMLKRSELREMLTSEVS